jgi:hypothetical protein
MPYAGKIQILTGQRTSRYSVKTYGYITTGKNVMNYPHLFMYSALKYNNCPTSAQMSYICKKTKAPLGTELNRLLGKGILSAKVT